MIYPYIGSLLGWHEGHAGVAGEAVLLYAPRILVLPNKTY